MQMVQGRKKTEVRQREIVTAARKLIVKFGSEHVTVRRLAREIGVSEGALYRHFRSKRDVLSFLVDDIEGALLSDIARNYSPGMNILQGLEKIATGHISAVEQRRGVTFQVIAEIISLGDKKLNKKVSDVIDKYVSHIKDILREGIESKVIRSDIDPEAAATLFFGMTQGLVNMWALNQYGFNLEQRFASLWTIFLEAVIEH